VIDVTPIATVHNGCSDPQGPDHRDNKENANWIDLRFGDRFLTEDSVPGHALAFL
jgi:hypothetical protein